MLFRSRMQDFHLISALSQSMQINLPVVIIGSFACLFAFLDVGGWQAFVGAHPMISMVCMTIQSLTLSLFGFYILIVLPYLYASRLGMRQSVAMVPLTVAAYFLLTPSQLYTAVNSEWLGHKGIVSVVLVTFLVVRISKFILDKKLYIRMHAGEIGRAHV